MEQFGGEKKTFGGDVRMGASPLEVAMERDPINSSCWREMLPSTEGWGDLQHPLFAAWPSFYT